MEHIITAIATASGESAIGIIRVSGQGCGQFVSDLFKTPGQKKFIDYPVRTMVYGHILDQDQVLDEVMAVRYQAPKSFTGEEMVEIFTHGSYIALREVQNLLIRQGASPAEPGEFTKRAFLNGRLDLSQAEAVMDLISSKTKVGFDVAMKQLDGHLSQVLHGFIDQLTDLMAQIEVVIDYPDEEIEVITRDRVVETLIDLLSQLKNLLKTYDAGKIIKDGLNLVIIGRPNVGKSSLLNALLRESRAIVTHIPGTTRDVIEEYANIKGVPVKLIDTAGIRETEDMIEQIGVEKTKAFFNKADMALLVFNASEPFTLEDQHIIDVVKEKQLIVLINKIDLEMVLDVEAIKNKLPHAQFLMTSLTSEIGLDALETAIADRVMSGDIQAKQGQLLTNARHYEACVVAKNAVKQALETLEGGLPLDLIEVDLTNAYTAIGEVIGKSVHEDVINRIFEKFCLGK